MIDIDEYESLLYDWKIRLTKEGVEEAKAHWFHENGEGLLAEVKRLEKVIDIMSCRMDSFDECLSLHEERVCGGIEGGCFLCEEIKTLQRGPYVWGENSPKSEAFYLEDGVWKEQEGEEE